MCGWAGDAIVCLEGGTSASAIAFAPAVGPCAVAMPFRTVVVVLRREMAEPTAVAAGAPDAALLSFMLQDDDEVEQQEEKEAVDSVGEQARSCSDEES